MEALGNYPVCPPPLNPALGEPKVMGSSPKVIFCVHGPLPLHRILPRPLTAPLTLRSHALTVISLCIVKR